MHTVLFGFGLAVWFGLSWWLMFADTFQCCFAEVNQKYVDEIDKNKPQQNMAYFNLYAYFMSIDIVAYQI